MRSAHPHDVYSTERLARLHASAARRRRDRRRRHGDRTRRTLAVAGVALRALSGLPRPGQA